jgi:hypothetical protein
MASLISFVVFRLALYRNVGTGFLVYLTVAESESFRIVVHMNTRFFSED